MAKKKYFLKQEFKNMPKNEIPGFLEREVFNSNHFKEHVKEVSFKTEIDEEIVSDILKSYFTNITIVINTFRKIKTKINVYGFFSLIVKEGKRI